MLRKTIIICLCLIGALCLDPQLESTKLQILETITNPTVYNKRVKPSNGSFPLLVSANSYILSFENLQDDKELFSFQVYFRIFWKDSRLKYDSKNGKILSLNLHTQEEIWVPDIIFSNSYKNYYHQLMKENLFIKIKPDGEVQFSRRINTIQHCPMDFTSFPFDTQVCNWNISSLSYNSNYINFTWKGESAVEVAKSVHVPLRQLVLIETNAGSLDDKSPLLTVRFVFGRNINYYFNNMFVPCIVMVMVSWTVFWIKFTNLTARILIATGSLYYLTYFIWKINDEIPKVPYIKAIDVFTGVSLVLVLFALIESIIIHCQSSISKRKSPRKDSDKEIMLKGKETRGGNWYKLDIVCRITFPVTYLGFNIAFWLIGQYLQIY